MTRHVPTCHPGMYAYLTAKYWGEQLSCPLFPFEHGSSVVYLVPICDNINRADFRWNANVQSKLGVQRVDDHIGGIHRITVLRLPPNCSRKFGNNHVWSKFSNKIVPRSYTLSGSCNVCLWPSPQSLCNNLLSVFNGSHILH